MAFSNVMAVLWQKPAFNYVNHMLAVAKIPLHGQLRRFSTQPPRNSIIDRTFSFFQRMNPWAPKKPPRVTWVSNRNAERLAIDNYNNATRKAEQEQLKLLADLERRVTDLERREAGKV